MIQTYLYRVAWLPGRLRWWREMTGIGVLFAAMILALVVLVLRGDRMGRRRRRSSHHVAVALLWPVVAVSGSMLLSFAFSVDRTLSTWRLLVWTGYLSVAFLAYQVPSGAIEKAIWVIGVGTVAWCWIEAPGGRVDLLANPNVVGSWLSLVIFTVGSADAWAWLAGAALLFTQSRGALLGVFSGFLVARGVPLRYLALGALAALLALSVLRVGTIEKRLGTWREAAGLFLQRPSLGWGPGTYPALSENEQQHPHADSWPLTVLAETGLAGAVSFLWLVVAAWRWAAASVSPVRYGLLAWLIQQAVDSTLFFYWVGITLALCVVLVVRRVADKDRIDDEAALAKAKAEWRWIKEAL